MAGSQPILFPRLRARAREDELALCDGVRSAPEPVFIDEFVGEGHDILVHSVLLIEVHDAFGMGIGQAAEERDVQASPSCKRVLDLRFEHDQAMGRHKDNDGTYKGWELEVVSNKDEGVREPKWAKTGWESDLRGLIHNTIVKRPPVEQRATQAKHLSSNLTQAPKQQHLLIHR